MTRFLALILSTLPLPALAQQMWTCTPTGMCGAAFEGCIAAPQGLILTVTLTDATLTVAPPGGDVSTMEVLSDTGLWPVIACDAQNADEPLIAAFEEDGSLHVAGIERRSRGLGSSTFSATRVP